MSHLSGRLSAGGQLSQGLVTLHRKIRVRIDADVSFYFSSTCIEMSRFEAVKQGR
jgi:hypothetical protein